MDDRDELRRKAQEIREMVARVRRLANGLTRVDDQQRLLKHAAELAADAERLERQAAEGEPDVAAPRGIPMQQVQQQVQQQQQHELDPHAKPASDIDRKPSSGGKT
jgi:hypothetical protein